MSRTAINDSVWLLSLLLQSSLLVLLFTRGLARRLPAFTALMAFYPLRSGVLFALSSLHLTRANYASVYNIFSLVDLFLQFTVAASIAIVFVRAAAGSKWLRGVVLVLLPCTAWAATLILCKLLPVNNPVPPDRLQMFNSLSMILLCAWAWTGPVSRLLRRITLGLAVSGLFSLSTIAAHAIAASSRDPHLFAIWSYTLTAAYLAVVLYWIATLKPDPTARTSTKPVL